MITVWPTAKPTGLMTGSALAPAHTAVINVVKATPLAANTGMNGVSSGAGAGAGNGAGPGAHMGGKKGMYGVVLRNRTGSIIGAGVAGIGNVVGGASVGAAVTP